jgi:hypothetical protein
MTPQPTPVPTDQQPLAFTLTDAERDQVCREANVSRGTLAMFLPTALTLFSDSPTLRRKVAGSNTGTRGPCPMCLKYNCSGHDFPATSPEAGA